MDRRVVAQLYDCIDQIRDLHVSYRQNSDRSQASTLNVSGDPAVPHIVDGSVGESLLVEEQSSAPQVVILIAATNRYGLPPNH
jgi:hypothetical protein